MSTRLEKIQTSIFEDSVAASLSVANAIATVIREKEQAGKPCVLGLATGSTPTKLYSQLVKMHAEEGLSFKNVVSFNLDEYFPMAKDSLQSYHRFMHEHLFDHVDIDPANIHIPDGTLSKEDVAEFCQGYEQKIAALGGIDIQILGIGRTGHIGFNEPGSGKESLTRLITLDDVTRADAASSFYGKENVPLKAITMGVGTILKAKKIFMLAWGEGKAPVIKKAVEDEVTDSIPATYLQFHNNTTVILDQAAAAKLTRVKTPWLLENFAWNEQLIRKAVIWLSLYLEKPILKLTNRDYADNGMGDIITEFDSAYNINLKIFESLKLTLTGWPGGKPNSNPAYYPERPNPFPKKSIIFSPHPDDDVISMGGTFLRLQEQGHDVHVAYQTSGNIAVFDDDALQYADFVQSLLGELGLDAALTNSFFTSVSEQLQGKKAGDIDTELVRTIKEHIRRAEAKAGARYVGLAEDHMHFLNLPFYETGLVKKKPIGEEDVRIIAELLEQIQPQQIFAAGDLSDPHGTHRVCLDAIFRALDQLRDRPWIAECKVWLYRGAWQEWDIEDIDMAIPLSPEELIRKRMAIFKHQSQKDSPLFPGTDDREFWQRAEARNRNTARKYDALGLPEYEAVEAFKEYHF